MAKLWPTCDECSQRIPKKKEESDVASIGMLKVKHQKLSLADCVVTHIAKKHNALILTTEEEITKIKGLKTRKISY